MAKVPFTVLLLILSRCPPMAVESISMVSILFVQLWEVLVKKTIFMYLIYLFPVWFVSLLMLILSFGFS